MTVRCQLCGGLEFPNLSEYMKHRWKAHLEMSRPPPPKVRRNYGSADPSAEMNESQMRAWISNMEQYGTIECDNRRRPRKI